MKFLAIAVWLVALGLPWFHTRPKPVLLPDPAAVQRRIAWQGPAKKSSPQNGRRNVKSRVPVKRETAPQP